MVVSRSNSSKKRVVTDALLKNADIGRALLEHAMVAVVVVDGDGCIGLVNAQTEKLFGYPRNELIGQPIEILIPERFRSTHTEDREGYFSYPSVRTVGIGLDLVGRCKDGTEFPAEIGLSPIETEHGTFVLSFITDISQRKRTDDALRESEARFRSLVETTSDWVWEIDANGFYTYASPKVRELLGYEPEEVIGKMPMDFMPRDEADRVGKIFWDIAKSRRPFAGLENVNVHKDGRLLVLETSGVPICDVNGSLLGYRGIDRDITERKQAGEQLRLQAAALASAANAMLITDHTGTIIWVNPAFTTLTGYTPEEAIGQTPSLLKSGKHDSSFYQHLWGTILSGRVWSGETTNRRKDGSLYTEEQSITPVRNARGDIAHFIAIKQDVTERRRLEVEGRERERLEDIIRFKSEFVTNVSHELRTPLNSIIGFSELLLDSIPGELNEKQAKYVNYVLLSGQHLLALITDILDLSKIEARKIDLELDRFPLNDALEASLTVVRPDASKKQITMTNEVARGIATITADPLRFKQIMYNLLSNAVKFTPDGGQVAVRAFRASDPIRGLPTESSEPPVCIAVSDTGIGISPEDQPKLFQEFSQLRGSHTSQQRGIGLGLALTKKLIELHGGRIWVESGGEGKGSTFFFTLPEATPSGAEP